MENLSLTDARAQLPHLLNRVAEGESFTITRHGAPVAVLVGNAEWMKTRQHDVIVRAMERSRRMQANRGGPLEIPTEPADPGQTDAWIADVRWSKESSLDDNER